MVAYSFKQRFVTPILAGTKAQTVRKDRRRHARPGEEVQLYTGLRTRQCRLIGRATCVEVLPITILFDDEDDEREGIITPGFGWPGGIEGFARDDGFDTWADLKAFWRQEHPGVEEFRGVVVLWKDFRQ